MQPARGCLDRLKCSCQCPGSPFGPSMPLSSTGTLLPARLHPLDHKVRPAQPSAVGMVLPRLGHGKDSGQCVPSKSPRGGSGAEEFSQVPPLDLERPVAVRGAVLAADLVVALAMGARAFCAMPLTPRALRVAPSGCEGDLDRPATGPCRRRLDADGSLALQAFEDVPEIARLHAAESPLDLAP